MTGGKGPPCEGWVMKVSIAPPGAWMSISRSFNGASSCGARCYRPGGKRVDRAVARVLRSPAPVGSTAMNVVDTQILSTLVHRERVHRSIYLDPAIFDLEMTRIFGRAWIYVGHESLVPKAGDYVTTRMGHVPVVLSRHKDGKVCVVYNSCGHRGAVVCNEERGNVKLFRCSYHGWTFETNGDLDAVSMPRGYGPGIDLKNPALGMG